MRYSAFGAYDWNDFFQVAETKVIEMELNGKTFATPEDRKRYVYAIACNLQKDYDRVEKNRRRILQESVRPLDYSERATEIAVAQQKVSQILDLMRKDQPKPPACKSLTATVIGTTMAAQLIEWHLKDLSNGEIACLVFKVSKETPAQTRKIQRAMVIAKKEFKEACKVKAASYAYS